MNKNVIYAVILGILILITAVQAYQLTTLKSKVEAGAVKVAGAKSAPATGGSGVDSGSGVDNLATMVGGC